MPTEFEPRVGDWYRNREDGQLFEVVAFDEDEGTIEIQYFEGEIEELDIDTWFEIDLEVAEAPEDWSAPFDKLERDDLGFSDRAMHPEDWSGPLNEIDRMEE